MNPKNRKEMQNMDLLKVAKGLTQSKHFCRWMSPIIPKYSTTIDGDTILKEAY